MQCVYFLLIVLIFIPRPLATNLHRIPCSQTADCDPNNTKLRCVSPDSDLSQRVCACRRQRVFDPSRKKCLLKVGESCDAQAPECIPGAICKPFMDAFGSTESRCECEFTSDSSSSEFCPLNQDTSNNVFAQLCQTNEDCKNSKTFLKCLSRDNSPSKKECSCGRAAQFDMKTNECVLITGATCTIDPLNNLRHPKCDELSTCFPDREITGKAATSGRCCKIEDRSCNSFKAPEETSLSPISAKLTDENLYGRPCTNHDGCKNPNSPNYLRCIERKCTCRQTDKYSKDKKMCMIGIGGNCQLEEYLNPVTQPCISDAKCKPNVDINGKELYQGVCCSKTDNSCTQFKPQPPVPGPLPTSSPRVDFSSKTNFYRLPCKSHDDCNNKITALRCQLKSEGSGMSCGCLKNSVFNGKECLHGVGSTCSSNVICIPGAECRWDKDKYGRKTDQGTCKCKFGQAAGSTCNPYVPVKSTDFSTGSSLFNNQRFTCLVLISYKVYLYLFFN